MNDELGFWQWAKALRVSLMCICFSSEGLERSCTCLPVLGLEQYLFVICCKEDLLRC
jgi:hypothetical protein